MTVFQWSLMKSQMICMTWGVPRRRDRGEAGSWRPWRSALEMGLSISHCSSPTLAIVHVNIWFWANIRSISCWRSFLVSSFWIESWRSSFSIFQTADSSWKTPNTKATFLTCRSALALLLLGIQGEINQTKRWFSVLFRKMSRGISHPFFCKMSNFCVVRWMLKVCCLRWQICAKI